MLCISAAYAVMRCLCVCPSVTFVSCVKTNKDIFKIFSQSGSQTILVFPCQRGWRYFDSLFSQDDDEVFVTGSTLYAGDGGQTAHPDTTPLVITPFSAAVGHHRTEPDGYFCWKLTLTRTPDPIRPTRWGPDPNRPTNGRKQGGLWPRGVCPGSFGWTPPETIRDSRTEFNRILCISKSEAAVTSNKKLCCRYVEANCWQTRNIARPLCDSRASCLDCHVWNDRVYKNGNAIKQCNFQNIYAAITHRNVSSCASIFKFFCGPPQGLSLRQICTTNYKFGWFGGSSKHTFLKPQWWNIEWGCWPGTPSPCQIL